MQPNSLQTPQTSMTFTMVIDPTSNYRLNCQSMTFSYDETPPPGPVDAGASAANEQSCASLDMFSKDITERTGDIWTLCCHMKGDPHIWAQVLSGEVDTGWNGPRRPTWPEFCSHNRMDGARFKTALEPVMGPHLWGIMPAMSLRTLGGDHDEGMLAIVDWMVSGADGFSEMERDGPLRVWLHCAIFLARHPDYPIPACMQPATLHAPDPKALQGPPGGPSDHIMYKLADGNMDPPSAGP